MPVDDAEVRRLTLEDFLPGSLTPGVDVCAAPNNLVRQARHIQVRAGGVLIYMGPGSLELLDGEIAGRSIWVTAVHTPSRSRRGVYLSGPLTHGASVSMGFRGDRTGDPAEIPCPAPYTATLELSVPQGTAEYLRTELNQEPGGTDVAAAQEAWNLQCRDELIAAFGLPEDFVFGPDDDDRLVQVRDLSVRIRTSLEGMGESAVHAAEAIRAFQDAVGSPEELRAALGFDEQDVLIESTRSEFPHDPHSYGRRYAGDSPMHWTPPADGEEVPRWLA